MNRSVMDILMIPALICALPFFLLHLCFPSIYHDCLSKAVKSALALKPVEKREEEKGKKLGTSERAVVSLFNTYFKSIIRLIGLRSEGESTLCVC